MRTFFVDKHQHECPDQGALLRDNFLSEFKTETQKALARANLGIDESIATGSSESYWGKISGTITDQTDLINYIGAAIANAEAEILSLVDLKIAAAKISGGGTSEDESLETPTSSFEKTNVTAVLGSSFTIPFTTDSDGDVTYASSNTDVATVSSTGLVTPVGTGSSIISASTAATSTYKASTSYFTVTVSATGGSDPEEVVTTPNPPVITCENNIVTITSDTTGGYIYYNTLGDDPVVGTNLYTGPITLSYTTTVKALVYYKGKSSVIASEKCTYVAPGSGELKVCTASAVSNLTYNGALQVGIKYSNCTCTSGQTSAYNAGSYSATFTANSGYQFADGSETKTISWSISKKTITVPVQTVTSFTYTGSSVSNGISYDSTYVSATDTNAISVGSYTSIYTLIDTTNCAWSDGTITAKSFDWQITKLELDYPTIEDDQFEYTGSSQTLSLKNMLSSFMVYRNTGDSATQINAGNYTTIIGLVNTTNTCWKATGGVADYEIPWTINKKNVDQPTLTSSTISYDGTTKYIKNYMNNYNSSYISLTGDTYAVDPGDYSVECSLTNTSNYQWSNLSTGSVTLNWSIVKDATKVLTPTTSNVYLTQATSGNYLNPVYTITVPSDIMNAATITANGSTIADNYQMNPGDTLTLQFTLNDSSETWSDSKFSGTLTITAPAYTLTTPSIAGATSYEYDGTEKQVTLSNNYSTDYVSVIGTSKATNVGNYNLTLSINSAKEGLYVWADGSSSTTLNWSITQAAKSINASSSITMKTGETTTVDYTCDIPSDCDTVTYSVTKSGSSINIETSGNTISITSLSEGSSTITITGTDSSGNYKITGKTITVTVANDPAYIYYGTFTPTDGSDMTTQGLATNNITTTEGLTQIASDATLSTAIDVAEDDMLIVLIPSGSSRVATMDELGEKVKWSSEVWAANGDVTVTINGVTYYVYGFYSQANYNIDLYID